MEKDSRYKFFSQIGNDKGTSGVCILLSEQWVNNILEVKCISDRICLIKINVEGCMLTALSIYAPQVGLDEGVKDAFNDELQCTVAKISKSEILFVSGDFHIILGRHLQAMKTFMVVLGLVSVTLTRQFKS